MPADGRRRRIAVSAGLGLALLLAFPTGFLWTLARPLLHKDVINRYAAEYKFDPLLIMALVKVESGFLRRARSHRGAVGLMQLMPDTAAEMASKLGTTVTPGELETPEVNIHLGVHYLSLLRAEFQADTVAVLAAYNGGPSNVREWKGTSGGTLRQQDIPFPETRGFVDKVLSSHRRLKRLQRMKNAFT